MEKKKTTKAAGVTLGNPGLQGGTSLAGYLTASYRDLVKVLGRPNCEGDQYKVSTEWVLVFKNRCVTLYDYKDTKLYSRDLPSVQTFRRQDSYEWHIGAGSQADIDGFRQAILGAIESLNETVLH
jgi:hypothetical protein